MRINGYGLSSSEVPLSQTGRKEQQSEISVAPVKNTARHLQTRLNMQVVIYSRQDVGWDLFERT